MCLAFPSLFFYRKHFHFGRRGRGHENRKTENSQATGDPGGGRQGDSGESNQQHVLLPSLQPWAGTAEGRTRKPLLSLSPLSLSLLGWLSLSTTLLPTL